MGKVKKLTSGISERCRKQHSSSLWWVRPGRLLNYFGSSFVGAASTGFVYRWPFLQICPQGLTHIICQGLNSPRPGVDIYLQHLQTPLNRPLGCCR